MTLRLDRLTNLRKERDLNQIELAEALGISQNQVSRYETGNTSPNLETLTHLADYFDTTTDYLLGRSNIPHPGAEPDANADLSPEEIELLTFFRARSAANRKHLLAILDSVRAMLGED